jgi:hypothetical protein
MTIEVLVYGKSPKEVLKGVAPCGGRDPSIDGFKSIPPSQIKRDQVIQTIMEEFKKQSRRPRLLKKEKNGQNRLWSHELPLGQHNVQTQNVITEGSGVVGGIVLWVNSLVDGGLTEGKQTFLGNDQYTIYPEIGLALKGIGKIKPIIRQEHLQLPVKIR